MEQSKQSLGQRWTASRPTKTVVFWSWIASIVVTMIIGFTWGGWVTGGTAQKMADVTGQDAVVKRWRPCASSSSVRTRGKSRSSRG